jgi:4-hydroxy-3-polyprenylbenzoate decarboxylase
VYRNLRDFIDEVDAVGALRRIEGADLQFEIGAITEVAAGMPECPALLFDNIKGYPPGFRIVTNMVTTPQRASMALGMDANLAPLDALKAWKTRRTTLQMQDPRLVAEAPFMAHSVSGADVDLSVLPTPLWHRKDGGPFIGSASLVVMRDPDDGWINASIYRIQIHDRNRVTIQFDHMGRHGAIIAKKYWDRGQACPVAVVNGQDPALFISGFEYLKLGASEYTFAGAIKGEPIPVYAAPNTGLPVPSEAESILEGMLLPMSEITLAEGPFGEFTGYYASEARPAPVMMVEAIHHRTDPILLGSPPMKPPRFHFGLPFRAVGIWNDMEAAGVTDIVGCWQHVSQLMTVVSLQQRYAGHAKRAGLIAAANSYMGRIVVVVDEDVDPSSLADVMWAVTTRSEPSEDVDIVRNAWSSSLDPRLDPGARSRGLTSNSKMIILACRPFDRIETYPPTSAITLEEASAIRDKWMHALKG